MTIRVVDPFKISVIVDKDNANENLNSDMEISQPSSSPGVSRDIIPVNTDRLREMRYTQVAAGVSIPAHSHEGPIFRLITDGEAVVNGKTYRKGDWMIIPPAFEYAIITDPGYTALWNCIVCF